MSGHKPFKQLRDQLEATPEGRTAVTLKRQIVRDLLALHKLREARGATQVELVTARDTSQTNVSRVGY